MYASISVQTDQPIEVYQMAQDAGAIWVRTSSRLAVSLSFAEAQQLITELQRELAVVEALARSAAA